MRDFCADQQESRVFYSGARAAAAAAQAAPGPLRLGPAPSMVRRRSSPLVGTDGPPSRGLEGPGVVGRGPSWPRIEGPGPRPIVGRLQAAWPT